MQAEIISVGTELLLGHIVDTNAVYISKKLAELGIDMRYRFTVGDNPARLTTLIKESLSRSDLVFTIGGLGPTVDDITMLAVGNAVSKALVFDKGVAGSIKEYFNKRRRKSMPKDSFKQALIPRGSKWFKNDVGTAPAVVSKCDKSFVVALPGPPREFIPLFEKNIIPFLKKNAPSGKSIIKTKSIKIAGLPEVDVNNRVKDILSMNSKTTVGIYTHLGEAELKITSKAGSERSALVEIKKVERKIRKRLGNYVFGADSETLESVVGEMLLKRKMTLALAESCTGGLLSHRLTNISRSTGYFLMGVIAYSNDAKIKLLGVSFKKIKKYGAVSKQVAVEMANGVKDLSGADIAVSLTGIAGPSGGSAKKPVGLVYIALVSKKIKLVKKCFFIGSREEIKFQASQVALDLLRATCVLS